MNHHAHSAGAHRPAESPDGSLDDYICTPALAQLIVELYEADHYRRSVDFGGTDKPPRAQFLIL